MIIQFVPFVRFIISSGDSMEPAARFPVRITDANPEREAIGPDLGGSLESNANVLTDVSDEACDPIGGSWANRGLLCRVYKVEGE